MTYPPETPFMGLDFYDRETVFMAALSMYHAALSLPQTTEWDSREVTRRLARLQLYVCGDPAARFEGWMLGDDG